MGFIQRNCTGGKLKLPSNCVQMRPRKCMVKGCFELLCWKDARKCKKMKIQQAVKLIKMRLRNKQQQKRR